MKKIILFLIMIFGVVGVLGNVFAQNWATEFGAPIYKGWNLVYGFASPEQLEGQGFEKTHIKAIFALNPLTQQYVRMYPNREDSKINIDDDILVQTAFWVYSDETVEGTLNDKEHYTEYWLYKIPQPYNERKLYKGWNFVGITDDMIDKSLNEMKGNCNIEKAYLWDSKNQQWGTINNLLDDKNVLKNEGGIGSGFILRVSNNCMLGESTGSVTSPPALPGSEPTNGNKLSDYIHEKDIDFENEKIKFVSSKEGMDSCPFNLPNNCRYLSGKYSYNGEIDVIIFTYEITIDNFMEYANRTYSNLIIGDWEGMDYYGYVIGDDLLIFWHSNDKIIFIQREPYDSSKENDYLENFLTVYINKYPSDLNLK